MRFRTGKETLSGPEARHSGRASARDQTGGEQLLKKSCRSGRFRQATGKGCRPPARRRSGVNAVLGQGNRPTVFKMVPVLNARRNRCLFAVSNGAKCQDRIALNRESQPIPNPSHINMFTTLTLIADTYLNGKAI